MTELQTILHRIDVAGREADRVVARVNARAAAREAEARRDARRLFVGSCIWIAACAALALALVDALTGVGV